LKDRKEIYMKSVLILRGLPGAGKSWYATEMAATLGTRGGPAKVVVCSADDYFMVDGVYRFNSSKLEDAHGACFRRVIEALTSDADLVVVDNTNLRLVEIAPYVLAAQAYGARCTIRTIRCEPNLAAIRNIHGVPASKYPALVAIMAEADAAWPSYWPENG
jgi:tRNA uridine 5-carbamoylmethylation protein Kti12